MFENDRDTKKGRALASARDKAGADGQASSPAGIARCLEMLASEADLLQLPTTALLIGAASLSALEEGPHVR